MARVFALLLAVLRHFPCQSARLQKKHSLIMQIQLKFGRISMHIVKHSGSSEDIIMPLFIFRKLKEELSKSIYNALKQ